jgi:heme A synthase
MRPPRSRWSAWLALALGVLGGTYSALGLAMVSSFSQSRTAAWIYLGALFLTILLALAAVVFLVRARRRSAIDPNVE